MKQNPNKAAETTLKCFGNALGSLAYLFNRH